MVQRYKFESKSQQYSACPPAQQCCFQWFKGTNLKANHNPRGCHEQGTRLFPMVQRYKFESKSQLLVTFTPGTTRCWFKGTNLKANHNSESEINRRNQAVSNGSKVQIWKQITTPCVNQASGLPLFPMVQRYKFESKSQHDIDFIPQFGSCFQWFKGTNLKANHNAVQQ